MTEEQIELRVQRKFDRLDADFLHYRSRMSQKAYDARARAIAHWAENEYRYAILEAKYRAGA